MAARHKLRGTFTALKPYTLTGVQVTERELGRGSYAVVLELKYRGLKCAGKKLYRVLYEQGSQLDGPSKSVTSLVLVYIYSRLHVIDKKLVLNAVK